MLYRPYSTSSALYRGGLVYTSPRGEGQYTFYALVFRLLLVRIWVQIVLKQKVWDCRHSVEPSSGLEQHSIGV